MHGPESTGFRTIVQLSEAQPAEEDNDGAWPSSSQKYTQSDGGGTLTEVWKEVNTVGA